MRVTRLRVSAVTPVTPRSTPSTVTVKAFASADGRVPTAATTFSSKVSVTVLPVADTVAAVSAGGVLSSVDLLSTAGTPPLPVVKSATSWLSESSRAWLPASDRS